MDIRYGISQTVRFEFPDTWDPSRVEGVYCVVLDTQSNVLAGEEMVILESVELDGAVAAGDLQITLNSDVAPGDVLLLTGSYGNERVRVVGYDTTSKVATLADHCYHAHDDESTVYGCFSTAIIDASDVSVFYAGREILTIFSATGDDSFDNVPYSEAGFVIGYAIAPKSFESEFSTLYPVVYRVQQASFDTFSKICTRKLKSRLMSKGVNVDRMYDGEQFLDLLLPFCAHIGTLEMSELGDVQKRYWKEYAREEEQFLAANTWVDQNQDLKKDDMEVQSYESLAGGRGF